MPSIPPQPPVADTALHAHFPFVTDALAEDGDVVTSDTTLAGLYRLDNPGIDNRFLVNTTRICEVKIRCQIRSPFDVGLGHLPPTSAKDKHGFGVFFTFNRLCEPAAKPYLKLALEFPFSIREGKQLRNFECKTDEVTGHIHVRFSSTGASSEGFALLPTAEGRLGKDEKKAVSMLQSLMANTEPKQLHLVLQAQEVSAVDRADFRKLVARLPGGQGPLFPSLGQPEWSNYPIHDRDSLHEPKRLMMLEAPNPMVPLDCPHTFSSPHHFKVDHLGCSVSSQWENETVLQLFAMGRHQVALYGLKGIPVIAMNYGEFPKNAIVEATNMRLPNELEIKLKFNIPGVITAHYTAVRDVCLQGLPDADTYFVITSHKLDWFKGKHPSPSTKPRYRDTYSIVPHPDSFLLKSHFAAMQSLDKSRHHKFHPIALGQCFDSLESVDTTANFDVPDEIRKSAWEWLKSYKPWNKEQLQLIMQLKNSKGGITLATGTAGTGKTTVQMAIAVYIVKMGGRAACFAASNSNVVTQTETLHELTQATLGSGIRVIRIVSTSKGIGFKHISATQALAKKVGHDNDTVSTIFGLVFMRQDQRLNKLGTWKHTLEACMLEEVDKMKIRRQFQYKDEKGHSTGSACNAWKEFRNYLEASLDDKFWEESNEYHVERYAQAFEQCKAHLIGLADIVVTTSGNAQCADLKNHWAGHRNIKGLAVLIDEVGKEQEINVWNAMLSQGLPMVPTFVMLLGDPEQLSPTNTSVTKGLQCNPFAARADMSMLDRLIGLGFPHIHLHLQQRMHSALWAFPGSEFYKYQDFPETPRNLEPLIKAVLDGIISQARASRAPITDAQTRLQYLDFGVQKADYEHKSKAIPKHIQAVFDVVLPPLQAYFGERMQREVLIIAAYGNAVKRYKNMLHKLQEVQKREDCHYPDVTTIDSAQGQEATMVIVDNSMIYADALGLMVDRGRCNVSMTRAKEVLWIVGGPLSSRELIPLTPYPKLKKIMAARGQVQRIFI